MAGSKFYSALDAAAAYHTIPVEKKSRPLLAFITPMGLFQFARMTFGPKNSGAVYARFVEMLLQKIRSPNIVAYIDDILIFTDDLQQHLAELKSVFEVHRMAGIMELWSSSNRSEGSKPVLLPRHESRSEKKSSKLWRLFGEKSKGQT